MDLYEVLGVRRNATAAEIRRAYQKLARRLHPDLNPGDLVAAESFEAVARAFEVLSDPRRRVAYDRGELVAPSPSPGPEVGFEGFDFSAEVRSRGVGFKEIFDSVLQPPWAESEHSSARGEDLEQTAHVSFRESLKGAERRVQLVRQDACPICRGSGAVAYGPVACPTCQGAGQVRASRGHMVFSRACAECGGTGSLDRRPCSRCRGEGRLMRGEWLDVKIPPGVRSGSRVRVPGCGNAGRCGGAAGDFVLVVEVEPHPFYRREEDDLHCVVPVTITEAAVGAHVEVPTPDGPMSIEVPAGTQAGQRFRLRKRGVPKLGGRGRGDLYVEARVWVPTVTDERSRKLLVELARRNPHDPRRELLDAAAAEEDAPELKG
jgi:molecular chaperone DnaJ